MPPFVKTHDRHTRTHTEAGKGWVGPDVARFPKQYTDTHRYKHVKTGPLAMETCRGTLER